MERFNKHNNDAKVRGLGILGIGIFADLTEHEFASTHFGSHILNAIPKVTTSATTTTTTKASVVSSLGAIPNSIGINWTYNIEL